MGLKGLGIVLQRNFKNTLKGIKVVGKAQGVRGKGRRMADTGTK